MQKLYVTNDFGRKKPSVKRTGIAKLILTSAFIYVCIITKHEEYINTL